MRGVLLAAVAVVSALGGVAQASVPLPPNDPSANTRVISFAPPPETVTCARTAYRSLTPSPSRSEPRSSPA